jgi:hypothetical protein
MTSDCSMDALAQVHPVAVVGHVCTCDEYKVLQGASGDYWKSFAGITRRIDSLAQDLQYKTVNNAFKMVAPTNGVQWLHWVLGSSDNHCSKCVGYSRGGRQGYYRVSWFMPKFPVHKNCQCLIELVFYDPFA